MVDADPVPRGGELGLSAGSGETSGEHNPVSLYLASLGSPVSRASAISSLNGVGRLLGAADAYAVDWASLQLPAILSLRAKLQARYAFSSANKMLSHVRSVLRVCWQMRLIDADSFQRACDFKPVPGRRLPAGRMLRPEEGIALFDACAADPRPLGKRDAAGLALMLGCGLRRAETVAVQCADIDWKDPAVRVVGKGDRERRVPCTETVMQALADWLAVRGPTPGALLVHCGQRDAWLEELLPLAPSGGGMACALQRRSSEAGIERCTPHDLRRTFLSRLLELGVDPFTVQLLAGHANLATTARYDRRDGQRMKDAIQLLDVPYGRRTG